MLEHQLERDDVNYALKNYEMPVNQQTASTLGWPICRWRCLSIRLRITRITFPGFTRSRAFSIRRPR